MEITSPDFEDNTLIPSKYTCDGEDISPTLELSGVPGNAECLAIIVDDPDAPDGTWVHWVLWNIDPDTEKIAAGTAPTDAIEGTNSFGHTEYGGPCPPSGTHEYFFRAFALDAKLDLKPRSSAEELRRAMEGKVLAQCELVGLYSRDDAVDNS